MFSMSTMGFSLTAAAEAATRGSGSFSGSGTGAMPAEVAVVACQAIALNLALDLVCR
jgi:hypothetical protein